MEQYCPICNKSCKRKIGLGVHLAKSHTMAERELATFIATLTYLMALVVINVGALKYLKPELKG